MLGKAGIDMALLRLIRIISATDMRPKERNIYEQA